MITVGLAATILLAQSPLPILRPSPPPVQAIAIDPVTPALALADEFGLCYMGCDQTALLNTTNLPIDSLDRVHRTRAAEWLARLTPAAHRALAAPVLRAELEAAVDDDSAAQRTFDMLLPSATLEQRSIVLSRAIAVFTDPGQEDRILSRRLKDADVWLARLMALPISGHATDADSLEHLFRVLDAARSVLVASTIIGDTARVKVHTTHWLAVFARIAQSERVEWFRRFPYEQVAMTFVGEAHGDAWLDSLRVRVIHLAASSDRDAYAAQVINDRISAAHLIGARAPTLVAHSWINTVDSIYQPVPRTRGVDDGIIRLLFFAPRTWPYAGVDTVLGWLQSRIAPWGQVVIVTHTEGHIGSAVLDPGAEVDALSHAYKELHVSPVIAIWAGAKAPGPFEGAVPIRSPNDSLWPAMVTTGSYPLVLVDGMGVVRGVARLAEGIRDLVRIERRLQYLRGESTGRNPPSRRPAQLTARRE